MLFVATDEKLARKFFDAEESRLYIEWNLAGKFFQAETSKLFIKREINILCLNFIIYMITKF